MNRALPSVALLALLAACDSAPGNNAAAAPANDAAPAAQANSTVPAPLPAEAAAWLPAIGTHRARAVAIAPPPEMAALAARITAGIRANPEWYRTYAAEHPQGELPWHSNLGVSEAEYRRFFALSRQLRLREVGPVTLTVTRRSDGGLALAATGAAASLDGIILYPGRDRAETPLGPLTRRTPVDNRDAASPTGPWRGVQWASVGRPGRPIQLALGRRARGDMILYYDFGPSDAETVTLLYPAPAS